MMVFKMMLLFKVWFSATLLVLVGCIENNKQIEAVYHHIKECQK